MLYKRLTPTYINIPAILFLPDKSLLFKDEIFVKLDDRIVNHITPVYFISNYGRIWNGYKQYFLHNRLFIKGYYVVDLQFYNDNLQKYDTVSRFVHRIVMLMFKYFPGCENYQVNHINGRRKDWNFIDVPDENGILHSNLEWVTNQENFDHAMRTGLRDHLNGEGCHFHVLTEDKVKNICKLLEENPKRSRKELGTLFGVDHRTICSIANHQTWKHISKDYNF